MNTFRPWDGSTGRHERRGRHEAFRPGGIIATAKPIRITRACLVNVHDICKDGFVQGCQCDCHEEL